MYKRKTLLLLFLLFFLFFTFGNQYVQAYTTGQAANVVIGQQNMTSGSANQGSSANANTLNYPYTVSTDGTRMAIADYYNSRVLIYNTIPTSNDASADIVLGQANFTSVSSNRGGSAAANTLSYPTNAIFADGKFIVDDDSNSRILIWNSIPTSNGQAADVVIGQTSMTGTATGTTASLFNYPEGIGYDSSTGKLAIADLYNHRVLIYNSIPTSNGASADVVIGQANMTSGTANRGGTADNNTLSGPYNARFVNGKLAIADGNNSRVLIYNSIPTSNGASADVVIGQANMTSSSANQGGTVAANTLKTASDMLYDGVKFYVYDSGNSRVLIYNNIPTSNNTSANAVLGQANLTSSTEGTSSTLFTASDGGFASTTECGKLLVTDPNNNRVLIFNNESPCPSPTSTPTHTQTSSSNSSSSSAYSYTPQISRATAELSGGVFSSFVDSDTKGQSVFVILEPHTFSFDAFLSSRFVEDPQSLLRIFYPTHTRIKTNTIFAGGKILGIKTANKTYWQVGSVQNIWYKAYAPTADKEPAKIVPDIQEKPSIIALKYKDSDLIPLGSPTHPFDPKKLKLAHSLDGVTWKLLPTSVVDTVNHTVAALDEVGGYYVVVGR